jgi:hypothetical protein
MNAASYAGATVGNKVLAQVSRLLDSASGEVMPP